MPKHREPQLKIETRYFSLQWEPGYLYVRAGRWVHERAAA